MKATAKRARLDVLVIWGVTAGICIGFWWWGISQSPLVIWRPARHHTEPIGEIRGAQTAGQTFFSPYPGLSQIEISLADYGRLNTGTVIFRLKHSSAATEVLREVVFPADVIRGDVMYRVTFAALPDSENQNFYFELAAPEAVPGNAITAYWRPPEPDLTGNAYWGGEPREGGLVWRAHFTVGVFDRAGYLLQQMTLNKPSLLGNPLLLAGVALVYLGLMAGLTWQVTRIALASSPEEGLASEAEGTLPSDKP